MHSTYTNPVADFNIGDPFVLKDGDRYFLFGTTDPDVGFRCYSSHDLVDWRHEGFALQGARGGWGEPPFWAPEVFRDGDRYLMTYSARDTRTNRLLTAVAEAHRPEGPYKNVHAPWFDAGYSAIDSHIFADNDGAFYLFFSENGSTGQYSYGRIRGATLKHDLSGLASDPIVLLEADQEWERVNYDANRANEGPFVFRKGAAYYMLYSANHTFRPGYGIGYAVAAHPLGPWNKSGTNPLVASGPGYSGAGHCSLAPSPDGAELFMIYHTHADVLAPHNEQRRLNIDRLIADDGLLALVGATRSPQPMPSGADWRE